MDFVFYEHSQISQPAHITPCIESPQTILHSYTPIWILKTFPRLELWTVFWINGYTKRKQAMGTSLFISLCSIHFSPVCLTRPPVSWMRARAPRAEWSSRQSSAPRYDHQFIRRHDFSACGSHYHLIYTVLHNIYKSYSIFYMKLNLYYMHCIKY